MLLLFCLSKCYLIRYLMMMNNLQMVTRLKVMMPKRKHEICVCTSVTYKHTTHLLRAVNGDYIQTIRGNMNTNFETSNRHAFI